MDEWAVRTEELRRLVSRELRREDERPRFDCSLSQRRGALQLDLRVPEVADPVSRQALHTLLSHPHTRDVSRLSIVRSYWAFPRPSDGDSGWMLGAITDSRHPIGLEWLFVGDLGRPAMDAVAGFVSRPRTLVTYNERSRFGPAVLAGVERLDLRDTRVDWTMQPGALPDLRVLVLRPHGASDVAAAWIERVLATPEAFPRLEELRAIGWHGDDVLARVLASPTLPQLRRLDVTHALTNQGAALLLDRAPRLDHIDELWVATSDERRRMQRMTARGAPAPPLGMLEITDDWNSRLRTRLGKRARFHARPGHPDLA